MRITASILSIFSALFALVTIATADSGHGDTDNPAIITVVDSHTHFQELAYTFSTLIRATGYPDAPVFVFYGGPLDAGTQNMLKAATTRPVTFVNIRDFYKDVPAMVKLAAGEDCDYQQKQRFLISHIWHEPVLEDYDVLMRISDTTCITMDTDYLPGFPHSEQPLNYKSYSIPYDFELTKYTVGLYSKTLKFISQEGISPENVQMFTEVTNTHDHENKIPKFSDDFEIVRKSWIISADIQEYHEYLADRFMVEQFYERKWSAQVVMFLTVALFSDEEKTSRMHVPGIVEKDLWAGNYFPNLCRAVAAEYA